MRMPLRTRLRREVPTVLAALALTAAAVVSAVADGRDAQRIVSVGGAVTEILYALGAGDRIAAVDTTSQFPPEAADKPDVGYMRQLAAEGVLSTNPDLLLVVEGSGPPDALAILQDSGIPLVTVPDVPTPEGVVAKIEAVGQAVGERAKAEVLADTVQQEFATLAAEITALGDRPPVLFMLSLTGGRITAAGEGTAADAIIALAGGRNAAAGFSGYKPMSDEAVIAAAPEMILTMRRGDHAASAEEVFALPALQSTPAAANRSLITMDGLFLIGFGPRTPAAARTLAASLHPGRIAPPEAP